MLGDAHPLATPELRPKVLTRACPDDFDLFSIEELTPEKRGSPKVNTALRTRVQPGGGHRGACPLTHAHTPLQAPRGISPSGASKRCLLDLLEMERLKSTSTTPELSSRVQRIAPGAPKRRLASLELDPAAQRRRPSLDFDTDSIVTLRSRLEETPLGSRACLWFEPIVPPTTTAAIPEPERHQPDGEALPA